MNRKDALRRLNGLAPQVEAHLDKIESTPTSRDVPHWKKEIGAWLNQMERIVPDVGDKTAAEWQAKIDGWKTRLGL